MQPMALFDAQGRSIRRTRTSEEILADIPPEVKEARRIIAEGGDPGPMPIDRLLYFGSPRHLELVKNRPDYFGISPPDYDIDRPEDLTVHGGSLLFGPMPQALSKIMTKYGEVFVPQDLALTAQTQWKTQPGIQVITGDHGDECCCVECCCAPRRRDCTGCENSRKQLIGVFIDGIVEWIGAADRKKLQAEDDRLSGMRFLCQRYGGPDWESNGSESWLYRGLRLPTGIPIAEDMGDQAEKIFQRLKKRICDNHRWDGERWVLCNRIDIDLFGYSRGAATAVLVAKKLSEEWGCDDCPEAGPLGPFTVRFLGIIDPATVMFPKLVGPLTHIDVPGTTEVPDNVRYFFEAYTDADNVHDVVKHKEPGTPGSHLENASVTSDWHLEHREMDDWNKGPLGKLEEYFNQMVVDPPLETSDKPACREHD